MSRGALGGLTFGPDVGAGSKQVAACGAVREGGTSPIPRVVGLERADITTAVAACLVRQQFPQWADLPVRPVEHPGWDNVTFRLGDDFLVRLPSADWYVAQVDKERRWLPVLAEHMPLPVPEPLAVGGPGCGFPRAWSVCRWLPGAHATVERVTDLTGFARALGEFLVALYAAPADGGPPLGPHNFFRGALPATYDAETRATIVALGRRVDAAAATGCGRRAWRRGTTARRCGCTAT